MPDFVLDYMPHYMPDCMPAYLPDYISSAAGASVAYSKGVEVCSTATAPIPPLPYVSCVKEVADVLEQWVRIISI